MYSTRIIIYKLRPRYNKSLNVKSVRTSLSVKSCAIYSGILGSSRVLTAARRSAQLTPSTSLLHPSASPHDVTKLGFCAPACKFRADYNKHWTLQSNWLQSLQLQSDMSTKRKYKLQPFDRTVIKYTFRTRYAFGGSS